jgi:hypothetical protein
VVIYNGQYHTEHHENENYVRVYGDSATGHSYGIYDCVGNQATVIHQWFPIDREAPVITMLSTQWGNPLLFEVSDEKSGVSLEDIVVMENGVTAPADSVTYDPATGILTYRPPTDGAVI